MVPKCNIADLPLPLRAKIIRSLAVPSPSPPIRIDLASGGCISDPLPESLLHAAKSSLTLAAAVADVLGPRAAYLNIDKSAGSTTLADWIRALAPFIQAVYFAKGAGLRWLTTSWLRNESDFLWSIITTLSFTPNLSLRVINFKHMAFRDLSLFRELQTLLHRHCMSLRELSVPASLLFLGVLRNVRLPQLRVFEVFLNDADPTNDTFSIMDLIAALNTDCLRDLRLTGVRSAPVRGKKNIGLSRNFISGVERLQVLNAAFVTRTENKKIAAFISSFPNLVYLRWNGLVTLEIMECIKAGCPHIRELHLEPLYRYVQILSEKAPARGVVGDIDSLSEISDLIQGTLRTIAIRSSIGVDNIMLLCCVSPNLRTFVAEISTNLIPALESLLQNCRQIRCLVLRYSADCNEDEALGSTGWQRFARAIQYASEELCDVIMCNEWWFGGCEELGSCRDFVMPWRVLDGPIENDHVAIVNAIETVIAKLGEKAKIVMFRIPTMIDDYGTMCQIVCKLLNAATEHASNLEQFELDLNMLDADLGWETMSDTAFWTDELLGAQARLKSAARKLHNLHLGPLESLLESNSSMDSRASPDTYGASTRDVRADQSDSGYDTDSVSEDEAQSS